MKKAGSCSSKEFSIYPELKAAEEVARMQAGLMNRGIVGVHCVVVQLRGVHAGFWPMNAFLSNGNSQFRYVYTFLNTRARSWEMNHTFSL